MMSEISFSELTAKCMKLSLIPDYHSILSVPEILRGNDSIRFDTRITRIHWIDNPKIYEIAHEIRKIHTDFFDCIIFATAIVAADGIGTFDESIFRKITKAPELCAKIKKINSNFKFQFYDFQQAPLSI